MGKSNANPQMGSPHKAHVGYTWVNPMETYIWVAHINPTLANPQMSSPHKAFIVNIRAKPMQTHKWLARIMKPMSNRPWANPMQTHIWVAHTKPIWVLNGHTDANPHSYG